MMVRLDGKSLRIQRPDSKPERVPLGMIGEVVVYGSPMISADVWRALSDQNVPAVIFPFRGTSGPAWLGAGLSTSIMVRMAQHEAMHNPFLRSKVVKWLLQKKLEGQSRLVNIMTQTKETNDPLINPSAVKRKLQTLGQDLNGTIVKNIALLADFHDIDVLRGLEGNASRAWFAMLAKALQKKWRFAERNRRPPKDPVNSLLSLTYTLLMSEVRREVQQRGLDPCLGFLHTPRPGRESFVLDAMEPLRPEADAFVLGLLEDILKPKHFSSNTKDGCRLNKEGRELYYRAWTDCKQKNWPAFLMSSASEPSSAGNHDLEVEKKSQENQYEGEKETSSMSVRKSSRYVIKKVVEFFEITEEEIPSSISL